MTKLKRIIEKTKDADGNLHSFNGEPAVVYSNGDKYWYHHGRRHRDNGPAILTNKGFYWYCNGKKHRLDGPAIDYCQFLEYWVNGEEYTFKEWIKLSSLSDEQKVELLLSHGDNQTY